MFCLHVFVLLVVGVFSVVGRVLPFEEQETLRITEEQMKVLLGKTPPDAIDKRGSSTVSKYKWPSSREDGKTIVKIPYILGKELNPKVKPVIERSIQELNLKTCIRFRPRSNENDYAHFKKEQGCSSDVGRRIGGQIVSLGTGCGYKGKVLHEMMHLLGYYHEHQRMDRDNFVRVYEENIIEGGKNQIVPKYHTNNQGLPYDLRSVMQYKKYSFGKKVGLVTIEARNNPGMDIGNLDGLSALDIQRLNRFYGCSEQRTSYKNYEVAVKTKNSWGAGTDAFVYLQLVGERGQSEENEVAKGEYENDFESGATEHFKVAFKDVGTLTQLKVMLKPNPDGSYFDGWTMEKVTINDGAQTYTFNGPKDLYAGDSVTLTAS